MKFATICASILIASAPAAFAGNLTYTFTETAGTAAATGTITTDGATGTLTRSDILSASFTVAQGTYTDTVAAPSILFSGSDLSATSSGLFFNFGDRAEGVLALVDSTEENFVCFFTTAGECTQYGPASITINANNTVNISGTFSGTQQIGAAAPITVSPVTVTPEPSSLVLLGTGVLSLTGATRRRLHKA